MQPRVAPYLKTAAMAAGAVGDSPLFLLDYALRLLRVIVLVSLWRVILSGRDQSAMALGAVLTYTLISEVFAHQLSVRTTITESFWEGTFVLRFLRPMGLVRQFAAEMSGLWAVHFVLFSIPLLALAPLLGVDPRPASAMNGVFFAVSMGLAVLVGLAMEVVFAAITVAMEQPVWLVEYIRTAVGALLSGSLLPLAYYPWGIGTLFSFLPFAAMAWAPLAIFTNADEPLKLVGLQVLWAAVLWPLGLKLWNSNREKLVGYGG
jgi:ABC-2 type transport system permease protein